VKGAILVALIAATVFSVGASGEPARAAQGACPVWQAERDVQAAKRAVARAEARLREARRVLAATERATALYGARTGRWARLARRVGWRWDELPTLLRVVYGESRGRHRATNGQYRGLMQHGAYWYSVYWSFDPYKPRASLLYGRKLKRLCGWEQWSAY